MTATVKPAPEPRVRLTATAADLPAAVAAAVSAPAEGTPGWVEAGGTRWATRSWGAPEAPPVVMLHGVTSNGEVWWRVGPAIAAAGHHVVAVDLPGHGRTQAWRGRHRFGETAEDVAGFIRAAGLDGPDLAVIGHSWGAMVAGQLPGAGLRPRVIVLVDPPALTVAQFEVFVRDPSEQPHATYEDAFAAMRAANPTWVDGDVAAKAAGLTQFLPEAVLSVLLENGDWDAGMAGARESLAAGVPVWVIRGEWDAGCLIPDALVPKLEAELGRGHVITIRDAPHSPQRTHPEATLVAMLQALSSSPRRQLPLDGGGPISAAAGSGRSP